MVSDLEEVIRLVRHCKQRIDRHKALRAKRRKVRDLLAQAILAQVRELARDYPGVTKAMPPAPATEKQKLVAAANNSP